MTPERFLNLSEAAEILRISEQELTELVAQGKIPAYKIAGEFLRFDKDQIEKFRGSIFVRPSRILNKDVLRYSLREKISDFLYYNDFYIFSFLVIIFLISLIFYK